MEFKVRQGAHKFTFPKTDNKRRQTDSKHRKISTKAVKEVMQDRVGKKVVKVEGGEIKQSLPISYGYRSEYYSTPQTQK